MRDLWGDRESIEAEFPWFDKSILGVGQGYYVLYIFHWNILQTVVRYILQNRLSKPKLSGGDIPKRRV